MIIINKIREHLKQNSIDIELEHFDNNIWKHNSSENVLEFDKIAVIYEVQVEQFRRPEESTNSTVDSNALINVKTDRLYLGDTEIRLSREQLFILDSILINNINVQ